ncbi:MAG: type II toxin-antitoxin system RelE/ParE family toxin [Saprospiraceae bacterium]|nr:type II toxin-antitoxin system RelE/ParE family toxin [Saprospiraceae bacterium]MCF8250366.1 type II toxin-antitoxin system RelE/ParE family toxin [Saprospiraceae bacterium]MCF8280397.1 type II toxin-antitoxin system RelE/ParE family toxin [Bacteroidales bacterium]MCF8312174.1 type II toxin-antitoxin system RelE/ParE family toxin [Saprospiraceae bacterium]MCF8441862.1 type II toxin-antitoxin system RelE/ParE family toxin [Saprospiraceae bacterium]
MAKTVVWKRIANQQILEIEAYLLENFSAQAVDKFLGKLYQKLEMLERFPESGQRTRLTTIRRLRINRLISLFYRIQGDYIVIHFVWNNRQDPAKNPYL